VLLAGDWLPLGPDAGTLGQVSENKFLGSTQAT